MAGLKRFRLYCKLGLLLLLATIWASQLSVAQTTLYSFESGVGPWVPNGGDDTTPPTLSQGTTGATDGSFSLTWDTFSPIFENDFSYINDGGASSATLMAQLPTSGRIAFDVTIPNDGSFTSDFLGVGLALNDDGGFQDAGAKFFGANPGTYEVEFELADFWTQPETWTFSELNISMNTNPGPAFANSTVFVDNVRLLPPEPPKLPVEVFAQDFDCEGGFCDPGNTASFYQFSADITQPTIVADQGVDGTNALQWQILGPGLDTVGGVGINNREDGSRIIGAPIVPAGQTGDFNPDDFVVTFDLKTDAEFTFELEFRTDDPEVDDQPSGTEVASRFYYRDADLLTITPEDGWKTFELNLGDAAFDRAGTNGFRPDLANLIQLNFAPEDFGTTTTILLDNLSFDYLVPIEAVAGDFNEDGSVNLADYTVWRDNQGSTTPLPNDSGLGTPVGTAHYGLWKAAFGSGTTPLSTTRVPEPSGLTMWLAAAVAGFVIASKCRGLRRA